VIAAVDVATEAKYFAYQLKYDSVHGRFRGTLGAEKSKPSLEKEDILLINGKKTLWPGGA